MTTNIKDIEIELQNTPAKKKQTLTAPSMPKDYVPTLINKSSDDYEEEEKKKISKLAQNNVSMKVGLEDLKGFSSGFRSKFAPYRELINNLTTRQLVQTEFDIIHCQVSNDSTRVLIVLKEDDENTLIQQYDTEDLSKTFEERLSGEHIKAKEIKQNEDGDIFLCPYFSHGSFHVLIFDKLKVIRDYNINESIKVDTRTRPNDNFPDPFCNACFVGADNIFINIYHSKNN
jgi:hypothetical protein